MIKKFAAALSVLAVAGLALPAFAEDQVSDAVDRALWCGSAYTAAMQMDGVSEEAIASFDSKATDAFNVAVVEMDADGIDAAEHDRLVNYYVEMAVENLTNPDAELRYTDAECEAMIAQ